MHSKHFIGFVVGPMALLCFAIVVVSCNPEDVLSSMPTEVMTETDIPTPDYDATASAEIINEGQTVTAQFLVTENAIASETAHVFASQTQEAGLHATSETKATHTALAIRIMTATARARGTDTPTVTSTPTKTNTPPPLPTASQTNTQVVSQPSVDMIVRSPGEKSPGDHGVQVLNKTEAMVTIIMYGDLFNYTFYVPEGNHKIFVRPGFYSFTYYSCGEVNYGSGIFNSNWYWEFWCN